VKEIAQKLKEARENNGLSLEEVAQDLNLRVTQLENIESGNAKAFKDVYFLKMFIKQYAKYLGLDSDELLEDFDEFIFDVTSKIPIDEIAKANKKKTEKKKIISPYTASGKPRFITSPVFIYIIIAILLLVIIYLIIAGMGSDSFESLSLLSGNWRLL